jgi:hypothetical protein
LYTFFIVNNGPLYVNFSISLCAKQRFPQGSCLVDMRFCGHLPYSPRRKNLKPSIHIYSKKWLFFAPKLLLYPLSTRGKNFFFNFECNDLVNGKEWMCKIDAHVGIQVSYKILWLEVPQKAPFCTICLAFKRGCFKVVLEPLIINL